MGLFENFPFTNLHQLNLDWIIQELKKLEQNAVLSVNGQTGDVVLYQNPDIVFPDVDSNTWRMVRTANGAIVGIMFQNGLAYVMNGGQASRVYTVDDPPTFPVTSVNGATGAVVTYPEAGIRFPDVDDGYMNMRRQIDSAGTPAIVGVQVDKTKAQRINGTNRYDIYDSQNQPPYPVSSVNGQTGAVILAIPFDAPLTDSVWMASTDSQDHTAGLGRETVDGTVELYTVTDGTHAEAYIHFVSSDDQYNYTKKLLTTDDIPSGSGVVSLNGQTGVVTLYGDSMPIESGSAIDTKEYIDDVSGGLGYVELTNTAVHNIPAGAYVVWKGNLYTASSAISIGDTLSGSNLSSVSNGGLNDIVSNLPDAMVLKPGSNLVGKVILAGYNTGSGNYFDAFFPADVTHINSITSVTLASQSAVFDPTGKTDLSGSELSLTGNIQTHGVTIEGHYQTTKSPNVPISVLALGLTVVCT